MTMARVRGSGVRFFVVLFVLLGGLTSGAGYVYYRQQHGPPASVLDPVSETWREHLHLTRGLAANTPVSVLLEMRSEEDLDDLKSWGLWVRFAWGRYGTASIPDGRFDALRRHRAVRFVKFIGPDARPAGAPFDAAPVVAIVDQDIDWREPALWAADGPRVLYYWDQADTRGPGPPVGPATYGTELTGAQLSELRGRPDLLPSRRGHGTSMSILAAGNPDRNGTAGGSPASDDEVRAPIILVNTTGKDAAVLDAIRYVVGRAEELGRNRVINLSFGKHFGRHDGRDPFMGALDAAIDERTLVVASVGNDGVRRIYATEEVRGSVTIPFIVKQGPCAEGTRVGFELQGWYDQPDGLSVRLEPAGAAASAFLEHDRVAGGRSAVDYYLIDTRLKSPDGRARGIHVTAQSLCRRGPDVVWRIVARSSGAAGRLQFWVTQTKDCEVIFPQSRVPGGAISALAAGSRILSVGAYLIVDGRAVEAPFSSYGFTGDGRWKPDLLAPTGPGVSPGGGENDVAGGTSAAAAVASSVAVRLWTAYPEASASDLRRLLAGKALVTAEPPLEWTASARYTPVRFEGLRQALAR
jgi:hypothetical protein